MSGGTLFTGKNCPAGHYSPGNIVQGDTKQGDQIHCDTVTERHERLFDARTSSDPYGAQRH